MGKVNTHRRYGARGSTQSTSWAAVCSARRAVHDGRKPRRLHGEEFAIVLPDTPKQHGAILAEKIRVMIQETKFEFESNVIPVTISRGVSEVNKGDVVDAFIQGADDKLYEGRQGGRNRVCS